MAIQGPLTNAGVYFGSYDFTSAKVATEIQWQRMRDQLVRTSFGSGGANEYVGGLFDTAVALKGWVEYGSLLADDQLVTALNTSPQTHVLSASPNGTDQDHVDFCSIQLKQYVLGEKVGALLPFDAAFAGRDGYGSLGGTILLPKQVLPSGTTLGTANNWGAVASGQSMYAVVHVFAVSGTNPTLDVTIKSAATSGGSYTTRVTVPQFTAVGDTFVTPVAGPITDTFWKANAVVGGTSSPTVTALVGFAIR